MDNPLRTGPAGAAALALGLLLGRLGAPWELAEALVASGGVFLILSASVWLRRRTTPRA